MFSFDLWCRYSHLGTPSRVKCCPFDGASPAGARSSPGSSSSASSVTSAGHASSLQDVQCQNYTATHYQQASLGFWVLEINKHNKDIVKPGERNAVSHSFFGDVTYSNHLDIVSSWRMWSCSGVRGSKRRTKNMRHTTSKTSRSLRGLHTSGRSASRRSRPIECAAEDGQTATTNSNLVSFYLKINYH